MQWWKYHVSSYFYETNKAILHFYTHVYQNHFGFTVCQYNKGQAKRAFEGIYNVNHVQRWLHQGAPNLLAVLSACPRWPLPKIFFPYVNIHQEQVGVPQIPLLGHWDTITTPYLAGRSYWPWSLDLSKVDRTRSVYHKCLFSFHSPLGYVTSFVTHLLNVLLDLKLHWLVHKVGKSMTVSVK